MILTPRAVELAAPVSAVLEQLLTTVALAAKHLLLRLFDDDHVVIGCASYALMRNVVTDVLHLHLRHVTSAGDAGAEAASPHRIKLARRRGALPVCR